MKFERDPLYSIFEKHLHRSLMNEVPCADTLVDTVVKDYVDMMTRLGHIHAKVQEFIERDVREEVTDILRKKIYGNFNLAEFRERNPQLMAKIKKGNA